MELTPAAFSYECDVVDRKVIGSAYGAMSTVDSLGHMPVSVAIDDRDTHKHEGDPQHPHVPWRKTVIYEMHVKGFTANAPWLPESLRGTYAGLAHPTTLAYLQGLGITSIELLPIMAKQDELFLQEHGRKNYWGYSIEPPTAYDYRVPSAATIDKRTVEVDVSQWIANPSGTANELKVGVDPSATDHAKVKGGEKSTVISVDLTDEARSVPYTVTNTTYGITSTAFIQVPAYGVFPPTLRPKRRR